MKHKWFALLFVVFLLSFPIFAQNKSVDEIRKAAEQGNATAQYNLGYCYENGKGVETDFKEAVSWFRKAAEQGNVSAQSSLGEYYFYGDCGVEQDSKEAVKWFNKAAEQGDTAAQYNLGISYYQGEGVVEDYVEAYKWFLVAGANGKDVSKIKGIISRKMSQVQVTEAQQKAKIFVNTILKSKEKGRGRGKTEASNVVPSEKKTKVKEKQITKFDIKKAIPYITTKKIICTRPGGGFYTLAPYTLILIDDDLANDSKTTFNAPRNNITLATDFIINLEQSIREDQVRIENIPVIKNSINVQYQEVVNYIEKLKYSGSEIKGKIYDDAGTYEIGRFSGETTASAGSLRHWNLKANLLIKQIKYLNSEFNETNKRIEANTIYLNNLKQEILILK